MFTAVVPPLEVIEDINEYLRPRREAGLGEWRWTRPETWHVTTAFMADVPDHTTEELLDLLGEAATATPAFDLRLAGARFFPDVSRAHILALDVPQCGDGGGHDHLAALASRCRNAATRAGVEVDGARFTGHLTLGRARRRPGDATRWARVLDSFPGWGFTADELVLVQSYLAERRHEVVGRWALAG